MARFEARKCTERKNAAPVFQMLFLVFLVGPTLRKSKLGLGALSASDVRAKNWTNSHQIAMVHGTLVCKPMTNELPAYHPANILHANHYGAFRRHIDQSFVPSCLDEPKV